MNVIDEFAGLLGEAPALSPHIRDRAKEKLMNELMSLEVAEPPTRRRRLRRRIAVAGVVAVAAASALVVGLGSPGAKSPLSPAPASAAVVAIRAVATAQRSLSDTPPDLTGINPALVALVPTLRDFPTDGTPDEVWSWLDSHCQPAAKATFGVPEGDWTPAQAAGWRDYFSHKDCGLLAAFAYVSITSPAQRASLLDALAALPKIEAVPGCRPTVGFEHVGDSQDFAVSRNGTDTVLSITENPKSPGGVVVTMMLTGTVLGRTFPPPCSPRAPANG